MSPEDDGAPGVLVLGGPEDDDAPGFLRELRFSRLI